MASNTMADSWLTSSAFDGLAADTSIVMPSSRAELAGFFKLYGTSFEYRLTSLRE